MIELDTVVWFVNDSSKGRMFAWDWEIECYSALRCLNSVLADGW